MTRYKINLIRDQVPTYQERNLMYWKMHLYILVTGILLVIVSHKATKDVIASQSIKQRASIYMQQFNERYKTTANMHHYLVKIANELHKKSNLTQSMNTLMDKRRLVSPFLSGVIFPLDRDMRVSRLFTSDELNTLEFDIACYTQDTSRQLDFSALIKAWHDDQIMSKAVKEIKPAFIQRQLLGGQDAVLLKFTAVTKPRVH